MYGCDSGEDVSEEVRCSEFGRCSGGRLLFGLLLLFTILELEWVGRQTSWFCGRRSIGWLCPLKGVSGFE